MEVRLEEAEASDEARVVVGMTVEGVNEEDKAPWELEDDPLEVEDEAREDMIKGGGIEPVGEFLVKGVCEGGSGSPCWSQGEHGEGVCLSADPGGF